MEEPMAMARLMWIVSELGFATRFPKETIILQKPSPDEDPECWRDAAYSIRHTPRRYSLLTTTAELVNSVLSPLPRNIKRARKMPLATLPQAEQVACFPDDYARVAASPVTTAFVSRKKMEAGEEPVKVSLRLAPLDL